MEPESGFGQTFRKLPTWLLTILSLVVFVGLIAGVYWMVGGHSHQASASTAAANPAANPSGPVSPMQKYIEVAGVRFVDDPAHKDQVAVKFMLINHSEADVPNLAGTVTLWGSPQRAAGDAEGTFTFITSLKPFEAHEMTAPLDTQKKIYELADWQNLSTDVRITAPPPPEGSAGQ